MINYEQVKKINLGNEGFKPKCMYLTKQRSLNNTTNNSINYYDN